MALIAMLCILPSAWSGWLGNFSSIALFVIAPIQQPVYGLTRWLVGGRGTKPDDAVVEGLKRERDQYHTLWLREQEHVAELERRNAELQRGVITNEIPVRQVATTVIGRGSEGTRGDLLIRAGTSQGVEINNVVTAGGVQIVGRVSRTMSRQSQVRLLTDQANSKVLGVVMNDDDTQGPTCLLHPKPSGIELTGQVEYKSDETKVRVGQLIRLKDDQWPRSASMLVIGRIVSVEEFASKRQVVVVQPTLEIDRVSEVVVRTNPEESDTTSGVVPAPKRQETPSDKKGGGAR